MQQVGVYRESLAPELSFQHLERGDGGGELDGLAPALGPWIYEASRPFADWYFGDPEVAAEILCEWALRPTAEVYAGRATLARSPDHGLMGCLISLSGAEVARCRQADFAAFCAELGSGEDAEAVLEQVVTAARELFPPVAPDDLYVSRVAVAIPWRNRGVCKALAAETVREARRRGYRRCRLDVAVDNLPAVRAYQAAGFRVGQVSRSTTCSLSYCTMFADV
jgi:ribosomal protein S18 acetylase RimI-like enzyme